MMEEKKVRWILGTAVFLISFLTYVSTVQPSVSFWDCGEFVATAYTLAVPHPPGAPFFLILGRFMAMALPFISDLALRVNFISVVASSFTVLLLFLISVRLVRKWRGTPKSWSDYIIVFGSSVIGALSLNFSDTFWFNAVEAEAYAASMLFTSCVVWLGMIWYQNADSAGSEKYLVLAAYLMGLSIGIHQLSLVAFFTIAMFVYFRHYEYELKRFTYFTIIAILTFFVIYPGIVYWIPDTLDGSFSLGPINISDSDLLRISPVILILALLYGIYYSVKHKNKILNLATLSMFVIIAGYSTYMQVYIRANAKTPINENNPDTMGRFVAYMNREQYGEAPPLLKRRWNTEPQHQAPYQRYTSDWDYFTRYQLGEMYLRYLAWNFIGRAGDIQGAPASFLTAESGWSTGKGYPNRYFALPFLLGLLGVLYHFKRDWKFALSFLVLFVVTGLALVVYFNMAEPQPRERDYFYVGSFFVFALWIGVGAASALEYIERRVREMKQSLLFLSLGSALIAFIVPVNMGVQNYFDHNRSRNYVPWDYSYNILQSCDKDAILFTNGDNDTFPLWYLQEVEHVRTDVRVANLSLLNTSWYILQLKNEEPHGAKKVAMSLSDGQIENLRLLPWTTKDIDIQAPKEVFAQNGVTDTSITNKGKITFRMPSTLQGTDQRGKQIGAIRVQDIMVREIVLNAKWQRPIYFAVTVSDDGKIGLLDYLRMEGLAMKLTPVRATGQYTVYEPALREHLFNEPEGFNREPHSGFKFRGLSDPTIYYNDNDRGLMSNYRNAFMRLALHYANTGADTTKIAQTMDMMERKIPRSVFPMDWRLMSDVARIYNYAGRKENYLAYARQLEVICWDKINSGEGDPTEYYNPYRTLIEIYGERKEYAKELEVLQRVQGRYPNDQSLKNRISQLDSLVRVQNSLAHPESSKGQAPKN
ncbi:MAG: DUF2723 domain-containing protein [Bacteroidota bacterium]